MSEETTSEHDSVIPETCISKEPSFHGRLQLKNFMFDGTAHASSGIRRSAWLQSQSSQTSVSASSESATPAPGTPLEIPSPTPRPARKRKSQRNLSQDLSTSEPKPDNQSHASSPSPRKKRNRVASGYAPPSTYAHLPPLIDVITPNLLILFIGLNPGVQTARSGHAYAHPSNLFWKLLYSSGITPVPCKPEEDRTLPERFSLGNTNIVSRPSRNGAELSKAEMDAGVAILEEKCRRWRPEAVCVVGKSIWESIFRVLKRRNMTKGEFAYGWQTERMGAVPPADGEVAVRIGADAGMKAWLDGDAAVSAGGSGGDGNDNANGKGAQEIADDGPWEGSRIFVATSTSGLAASLSREEKERIWKILGDWCVQRRKERAEAEAKKDA
ncbi:DNA glycosylase [Nemania abortiva]|nr:DNA glycosylase [Nemania abortiva]